VIWHPNRLRGQIYLACVVLGLTSSPVFAKPEQGPTFGFTVPRAEVLSTVKSIGIMPVIVTSAVSDARDVAARYESDIVVRLTSAGFTVIPPSAMREIRERTMSTLGGVYDPITGEPIKEKVEAFYQSSADEYLATQKVDGILGCEIAVRSAHFAYGSMRWDGVEDSITGESAWANFWKESTVDLEGKIPTLSLIVRLQDAKEKSLYVGVGGLQVLGYWNNLSKPIGLRKERLMGLDPKFIMTDPARDARALSLALDPLLYGKVSALPKVTTLPAPMREANAPPKVSREEVLAHFPRIALASLDLSEIKQSDELKLRYRDALTKKLTQLGFEVVGGDDYDKLWNAEREAAGGYYDPFTGRFDELKFKASIVRVVRAMKEHFAASAVLLSRVLIRRAPFDFGVAEWDGTNELLTPGTSKLRVILSLDPAKKASGSAHALSLELLIIDPAAEPAFEGLGGVQLTEHLIRDKWEPVPKNEQFLDALKLTRAIDIALAPLITPNPAVH
jgi:hypothetical protein